MAKGILRFFFDYGAGGCLWAADKCAYDTLGVGPVDAEYHLLDGRTVSARLSLSERTINLRDQLDRMHSGYLNPLYPPDPSLWSQSLCDHFNAQIDELLVLLRQEISEEYDILDQQKRYVEDDRLDAYLVRNPTLAKLDEVKAPSVR